MNKIEKLPLKSQHLFVRCFQSVWRIITFYTPCFWVNFATNVAILVLTKTYSGTLGHENLGKYMEFCKGYVLVMILMLYNTMLNSVCVKNSCYS